MKWLVTLVLLAGISVGSPAVRADGGTVPFDPPAQLAPTTPQVPAPQVEAGRAPPTTPQVVQGQPSGIGNCTDCGGAPKTSCLKKTEKLAVFLPNGWRCVAQAQSTPLHWSIYRDIRLYFGSRVYLWRVSWFCVWWKDGMCSRTS